MTPIKNKLLSLPISIHLCKSFVSPDCDNRINAVLPYFGMSFFVNSAPSNIWTVLKLFGLFK